jgi:PAS domain S-box-containing protein
VAGFKQSLKRWVVTFGPVRTAALMGLLLLASVILSIRSIENQERQTIDEARRLSASYAAAFAEYSELAVYGADQVLQTAVARFGPELLTRPSLQPEIASWMQAKLDETNLIVGFSATDAQGVLRLGTDPSTKSQDRRNDNSFLRHRSSTDPALHFWLRSSAPRIDLPVIEITRRLETPSKEFAGLISGYLDPGYFTAFFKDVNLPEGSSFSLLEREGSLLMMVPHREALAVDPTHKSPVRVAQGPGSRISSTHPFSRYPLMVRIELPTDHIFARSRDLGQSYTAFILVLALMAALVVGLIRTLSKRMEAESRIRILSLAVENSPMSVIITDDKGRIEYVNPFFTNLTGFTQAEAIGQNPRFLKSGHMSEEGYARMWKAITSGQVWHGEFHNLRKNGSSYWELAAIAPIRDESGRIGHFVAVKEDITLRKEAETNLLRAKEMAEEANRAKSSFLANMSHELRTPLNAVIGFADMLSGGIYGPMNERQQEALQDIHKGGAHLLDIINDVLDMSRIEAGRYEITEQDIDLGDVIQDAMKMTEPRAAKSAIQLSCSLPKDLPRIWGDQRAVRQVVINLLSNAVKFTPRHGRVDIKADTDTRGGLWVSISDTGPGISQEDLDRLFQPFQQGEQWLTRQHEGTGLGLTISKRLMEMHGGTIRLESTLGQGTTVWLRFPPTRIHADAA